MISTQKKLSYLKYKIGLNIIDLACIFKVKRSTVFLWTKNKVKRIKQQKKLDLIYELFTRYYSKKFDPIGDYLYKIWGTEQESLLDLLSAGTIDFTQVVYRLKLIKIAQKFRYKYLFGDKNESNIKKRIR